MTITALPTPPLRGQSPTTFSNDADTFLNALPTMVTQINATTANMDTQYGYVYSNVSTTASQAAQATTAANSAISAKNTIEVLFLGSKASNPTTNNSGGALVVGCKYFNTAVGEDRVWTGTNWVASTALGGTVASLNVDGLFKLKTNMWHQDSATSERLFFESNGSYGGSQRTILRGNELNFWNNAGTEVFKVVSNGGMFCTGQASLNSNGVFMAAHSVTVGGTNGGGNTVGFGATPGGPGGLGQIGADSNHLFVGSNTYYIAGDRFSANGYAPKIRLFTTDNSILFQQTDNGIAGNVQNQHTAGQFDSDGVFSVRSRNGWGWVAAQGGGGGNTGFFSLFRPGGERTGYIGNAADVAGSTNLIAADNNHPWRFAGKAPQSDVDATLGVDLPRLSQFTSSQAANGYTKLPNGLIIQWGTISLPTDTTNTVSLNIAFPNNNFAAWTTMQGGGLPTRNSTSVSAKTLTNITIIMNGNSQSVYWMAIGN